MRLLAWIGILTTAAVAAPEATAQGPNLGGALADFRLLDDGDIRRDLKLGDDQARDLAGGLTALRDRLSGQLREAARIRKEGGEETLGVVVKGVEGEVRALVGRLLTPEQRARYDQIKLRDRGPWALIDPQLQSALALSDDQKWQVDAVAAEFRARVEASLRSTAAPPAEPAPAPGRPVTAMELIYDDATRRLVRIPTAEQRRTWEALLGEPIARARAASKTP